MICPLHAWGDESIRSHGLDAPAYLLGASIVDTDDVDATRDVLNTIHPGAKKLHWRDLDGARRDRVTSAIASLRAAHLVIVGSPVALRRQERARAFCLRRLLWELDAQGVSRLSLEARPAELMRRDRRLVDALRAQRAIAPSFRVSHELPDQEPMLWVPDQVLGIVGASLAADHRRMAVLDAVTTVVRLADLDLS